MVEDFGDPNILDSDFVKTSVVIGVDIEKVLPVVSNYDLERNDQEVIPARIGIRGVRSDPGGGVKPFSWPSYGLWLYLKIKLTKTD